jgi:hypothetical protein
MFLSTVDMEHLLLPRQTHAVSAYHVLANNLLKGFKNLRLEGLFPLDCPQSRLSDKYQKADQDALKLREFYI